MQSVRSNALGSARVVLQPSAGSHRRRSKAPLSPKAKWAIVLVLTALHPALLFGLYPIVGDAINTLVIAGPVAATLLFSMRVGVPFMFVNITVSGLVYWRLTGTPSDQGLPKAFVSLLVTTAVCWGADRLRQFIEERKVMEDALRQAQKMEAVGRLAAGVAHDINNTLNAITGSAFALRHELAAFGRSFQDLDNIALACDRGAQLTRNLLGFSRKTCASEETFSLNAVVQNVRVLLSRAVSDSVQFELELTEPPPLMVGDQTQIEHAVMNLCLNALDAMEQGGTLTLSTNHADGKVSIRVLDTGTGMDEQVREQAFEPFFTTKPVGKGTGMGLSMVYGTVQAMHGTIALASQLGVGTAFTLTFPQAAASLPKLTVAPAVGARPGLLEGQTVLVVDDEPLVLRAATRQLSAMGCKVLAASSGREGIEVFGANRDTIALAIIDLVMPNLDGMATAREILALAPKTPVLLASGYAPDLAQIEALFGGRTTVGFVPKPCDAATLLAAAAKLLRARTATTMSSATDATG